MKAKTAQEELGLAIHDPYDTIVDTILSMEELQLVSVYKRSVAVA